MKLSTGLLTSLIIFVVLIVVFLGMASSLIPTAATSYHNFSDAMAAQSAVIGTNAATFAGNTDDYLGWLWVAGPFVLIFLLVVALFFKSRGSGGYRRGRR